MSIEFKSNFRFELGLPNEQDYESVGFRVHSAGADMCVLTPVVKRHKEDYFNVPVMVLTLEEAENLALGMLLAIKNMREDEDE